jgi:type IV secretory pathway VirB10-like protein
MSCRRMTSWNRRADVDQSTRSLVMLCICVGVGAVAGGFALLKWKSEESAATSPPRQTPAEAPRTEPKPIAQPPVQPLPQPVAQPRAPTQAPVQVLPVAAPEHRESAVPPDPEGAERLRRDAIAVRKRRQQRRSEADYVWSQELKALVPAEYLEKPPVQPNAPPGR